MSRTPRPPAARPHPDPPSRVPKPGLARLRMDLFFVGTPFKGWQLQARGTTVQGLVDEALGAIGHQGAKVVGCSRTDAGVHARTYTAHVDTPLRRAPSPVLKGLNANLPAEVRVYRCAWADPAFHARYSSIRKSYRYHLYLGPVVPPALAPFVWHWHGDLDRAAMGKACGAFLGEHDFENFTTGEGREKNTRRTIDGCRWEQRGPLLVLHVTGRSFLHRMVRCMAGALVGVGTGRLSERDLRAALEKGYGGPQIPALPAQGLALWEVNYPGELEPKEWSGAFPEGPVFPL